MEIRRGVRDQGIVKQPSCILGMTKPEAYRILRWFFAASQHHAALQYR